MVTEERLSVLLLKWTNDSEGFRTEARRLERADRDRHSTSFAMLEAYTQAIEKCIMEVRLIQETVDALSDR